MKKMIFTLVMMLTATMSASAMTYEQARNEALFLTDKMAYELNLTDAQYEAAYEINLDYLMGVASVDDVFGTYWERRNMDLSYILYSWQWDAFRAASYFYRPLYWDAGFWHFGIYARYPRRDYFYFGRPHFYATYRGGHAWHMNGGRSYYHGHASHFRPALPHGHSHFGMRNSFDRGDFRGSRAGSSTRITSDRDRFGRNGSGSINRNGNYRGNSSNDAYNRGNNSYNRNNGGNSGNFGRSNSGNFGRSNSGNFDRSNSGNFSRSNSGNFGRSNSGSGSFSRSTGGSSHSMGSSHNSGGGSHSSTGGGGHFGRVQR
jgi:hypothetical protein